MIMSAPIECCMEILSSGCVFQLRLEDLVGTGSTHREHSRLSREWTREESPLFSDLRESVERYELKTTTILHPE